MLIPKFGNNVNKSLDGYADSARTFFVETGQYIDDKFDSFGESTKNKLGNTAKKLNLANILGLSANDVFQMVSGITFGQDKPTSDIFFSEVEDEGFWESDFDDDFDS